MKDETTKQNVEKVEEKKQGHARNGFPHTLPQRSMGRGVFESETRRSEWKQTFTVGEDTPRVLPFSHEQT